LTVEIEREELIGQLREAGVKHNPDNILRIARLSDSKIVSLEIGNDGAGGYIFGRNTRRILQQGEFLKTKLLMLLWLLLSTVGF